MYSVLILFIGKIMVEQPVVSTCGKLTVTALQSISSISTAISRRKPLTPLTSPRQSFAHRGDDSDDSNGNDYEEMDTRPAVGGEQRVEEEAA